MNEILDWALKYAKAGMSVIPVGRDKKPFIKWQEFQTRIASEDEIKKWFTLFPDMNIGLVTGKISNLAVIDVEQGGDISIFPETTTIKTGGGGYHLYYKYQPGIENKTRILPLTDIRGEGGYVVASPSIHKSGNKYEIIKRLRLAQFPVEIFGLKKQDTKWGEIINGVGLGSRNESGAKYAGKLLRSFPDTEWETIAWPAFRQWNAFNEPPLPENELRNIFDSIKKRQSTNPEVNQVIEEENEVVHISLAAKNNGEFSQPIAMGFSDLDNKMDGGVREGDLIVITGISGEGKTTFAQNITLKLAKDMKSSLWFSYEVIVDNLYAKFKEMSQGIEINNLPIFVPQKITSGNIGWIKEKIIKSQDYSNTQFVFIDHLDFISPNQKMSSDQKRIVIKEICTELKSLAIELKVIIFLMAHVKKVQGREVEMQDLAESSGIYQLADYVFSVQRIKEKKNIGSVITELDTDLSIVKILKNRKNGKKGIMRFNMENNLIKPLTQNYENYGEM